MADVYVDSGAAGLNNGTSWTDAYTSWATAFNGTNVVAGDRVFVKNNQTINAGTTITGSTTMGNPVLVFGCATGTTAVPPATSDLIPGWRTGDARTEANLAYNDAGIPQLNITGALDLTVKGHFYFYGVRLLSDDTTFLAGGGGDGHQIFEECRIDLDTLVAGWNTDASCRIRLLNSHVYQQTDEDSYFVSDDCIFEMIGGKFTAVSALTSILGPVHNFRFSGVDFSDAAHTLMAVGVNADANPVFQNCQLNATTAIASGTRISSGHRIELYQCPLGLTGKTSGTILNIDISDNNGDITEETTVVRTGGANDGTSNWSLSFTPHVNGTRDQYEGLIGPWIAFPISAGSQVLSIYIAHSRAAAAQNDEVYAEVLVPSEGGTSQFTLLTSQMQLLGTPANIATDSSSTWGGSPSFKQEIKITVAPDYDGIAYFRVIDALNYAASPVALYADPRPALDSVVVAGNTLQIPGYGVFVGQGGGSSGGGMRLAGHGGLAA